ncbi:acyl-CoA reductase [Siphonobacter sp.]|uniref:acyl-CoA reductase n=1 Tax=Siphonobacter sp. TaxID=1869184 RepID=UPI003B3B42C7
MQLSDRIQAFVQLGNWLSSESGKQEQQEWAEIAYRKNGWFIPELVVKSLQELAQHFLTYEHLTAWADRYPALAQERTPRKVGLILAGNIPAVGFHDILCVLIAGHHAYLKPSSQDEILIRALLKKLVEFEPRLANYLTYTELMKEIDAIIATGSDNSARHFHYYFAHKPHLIRKNRTSVAVLSGNETSEELLGLGRDILTYYGLGCRNVSKVYVPNEYDFTPFFEAIASLETVTNNHKYVHNYDYNRSIYLVNRVPFLDNGFLSVTASDTLVSPISVLFYERYGTLAEVEAKLAEQSEKIQCVVGTTIPASIPFGQTQSPELWDYADGVDTLQFLIELP